MIECKCGAKYPTERVFCGKCRERLGVRCSICGFINLLDDLYCGICLSELKGQTRAMPDQEPEKAVSNPDSLYEEIRMGVQEDAALASGSGMVSQEEIENLFQKDDES